MNDSELLALVALTNQETMLMAGENQQREHNGDSPAFTFDGWGPYSALLHQELVRREVFQQEGRDLVLGGGDR